MKKLISLVVILAMILSIGATTVQAVVETAKLDVKLSASTLEVGKEVVVTVNWTEKMEGVEFILGYDKTKVELVSASIADTYYSAEDGKVNVAWFTAESKPLTNMTFTFKTIAEGSVKFTTSDATLADADVESPETYTYGSATLTIKNATKAPATTPTTTPTKAETKPAATPTKAETKPAATETKEETKATEPKAETKTETKKTDKKPKSIPQAGMQVTEYVGIALGVIALIAVVTIVTKKVNKNK